MSYIPAATQCAYPKRDGNHIRPLIDGMNAFRRICEAVEAAEKSVWVTVAFLEEAFQMPDGRGSLFDVLEAAMQKGIDVKVIFWRSPTLESNSRNIHFHGQDYQRKLLMENRFTFQAQWDYLPNGKCHHQKSWLIDADTTREIAFVGGINLGVADVVEVGHPASEGGSTHDVYCELMGPSATDVHHNFVQRWNESSERSKADGSWPITDLPQLTFPVALSKTAGSTSVQLSRTVRRNQYINRAAAIGMDPLPIELGEKSTLEQYLLAIGNAKRTIYIEDQAIASLEAMQKLEAALQRGVKVVFLVPGNANSAYTEGRRLTPDLPMYKMLSDLAQYPNFTLAAIASQFANGSYCEIYVHAKIAIVDDCWATIGSCNFADRSFHSDTELNVTFWDEVVSKQFRVDLFKEHLNADTSNMTDEAALEIFRSTASNNAQKRADNHTLVGLAYEIDPVNYGL